MAETSGGSGPTGTTTSRRLAKRVRGSPTGNTPHHPQKRSSISSFTVHSCRTSTLPVRWLVLSPSPNSFRLDTGALLRIEDRLWLVLSPSPNSFRLDTGALLRIEDRFWGWCGVFPVGEPRTRFASRRDVVVPVGPEPPLVSVILWIT